MLPKQDPGWPPQTVVVGDRRVISGIIYVIKNGLQWNDARGLAQLLRIGADCIKPVITHDCVSQKDHVLLTLRQRSAC
jgi:hypothetical protein